MAPSILVVDDEPTVRKLMVAALRGLHYEVVAAASAEEALLLCESRAAPFDLVVSDVVMPGRSGPAMMAAIRQMGKGTVVLYVSAHPVGTLSDHGLEDDADFLGKPFSPNQLRAKVAEALAGRAGQLPRTD